ncbi:MAG: DUF4292 domain-containing protein, partial [bacterium]
EGIFDPSVSESELIDNANEKRDSIDRVLYKRASIQYSGKNQNQTFRSNIFLKRDSLLIFSVLAPFGIEVARVKFSPEEVIIIDRMNKDVIYTNYEIVKKKFNIELNFNVLQSLFLNEPFSYYSRKGQYLQNYDMENDDNLFCLRSLNDKKYKKLQQRGGDNYILHSLWLDTEFYLQKTSFKQDTGFNLDVNFNDFTKVHTGFLFPGGLNFNGHNEIDNFSLDINFGNITFNGSSTISFNIPDKYESIYR